MKDQSEYAISKEWQNGIDFKPIVYDIAEDFIYFLIFYPSIALFLLKTGGGILSFAEGASILLIMILMTINRRKSGRVIIYLLFEACIIFVLALIPFSVNIRAFLVCCAVVCFIVSFRRLINEIHRMDSIGDVEVRQEYTMFLDRGIVYLGSLYIYFTYMISLYFGIKSIIYICFLSAVLIFVIFHIYIHKAQTFGIVKSKSEYGENSLNKIKGFNFIFIFWSIVIISLVAWISYNAVYASGLNKFDGKVIQFFTKDNPDMVNESIPQKTSRGDTQLREAREIQKALGTGGEPGMFANFLIHLADIVGGIIFIGMIVFLLAAVTRFIRTAYKRIYENKNEKVQTVFSVKEAKKELNEKIKRIVGTLNLFSGKSNKQKIRKAYYKIVKKYKSKGIKLSNSDVPFEINEKVKAETQKNITSATKIYEKARYGRDECTDEDVKNMQ